MQDNSQAVAGPAPRLTDPVSAEAGSRRWRPSLGIRARADAEEYGRLRFVEYVAGLLGPADRVLDAGAGDGPHAGYFRHTKYESCDIEDNRAHSHAFLCDVQDIPKEAGSYDAVLCIQVLSCVPDPQRAITEFHRVLRPGGSLFLTAPQGWGIHSPPHHYFNFTCFGLERLFRNAGFEIVSIKPRGGMFWYLGRRIRKLPTYIFDQYRGARRPAGFVKRLAWLASVPVYWLALPLCRYAVPLVCFYLDPLDKAQDYTLGYACHCRKPAARNAD